MILAPDPDTLVTAQNAHLHDPRINRNTIQKWVRRKKLVAKTRRQGRRGYWQHLYRLGDVQALLQFGGKSPDSIKPPPGFLYLSEAAIRLGLCEQNIRRKLQRGTLQGVWIEFSTDCGRWFVCEKDAARFVWETNCPPSSTPETVYQDSANPLLSADHDVCLQARRDKFVLNGRRFRWKALAGRKRAG